MKLKKQICFILIAVFISGCGDKWIGEKDTVRLEGDRISVMLYERKTKTETNQENLDILLPKPENNEEWTQFGGFSHNAMHHLFAEDNIKQIWHQNIGKGSSSRNRIFSRPIIAKNMVFAVDADARVSSYNLDTGRRIWQKNLFKSTKGNSLLGGGISYDKDRIFVTTGMAEIFALNADNGEILWQKFTSSPIRSAPTVYGGRVFTVTADNKIFCFAASDGKELWSHDSVSEVTNILGGASPAVDEGAVIVAFSSGEIHALRVDNGNMLWADSISSVRRADATSNISDIIASPVIDRGSVYTIGNNNLLASIDMRTGSRIWEREIGGINMPWVAGNYLFVISNENELVALDKETGKILWVYQLDVWENPKDQRNRIVWYGPILVSDRLIVAGTDGRIFAISPYDGSLMGFEKVSSGVSAAPIAANGSIIFLTNNANLIKFK